MYWLQKFICKRQQLELSDETVPSTNLRIHEMADQNYPGQVATDYKIWIMKVEHNVDSQNGKAGIPLR